MGRFAGPTMPSRPATPTASGSSGDTDRREIALLSATSNPNRHYRLDLVARGVGARRHAARIRHVTGVLECRKAVTEMYPAPDVGRISGSAAEFFGDDSHEPVPIGVVIGMGEPHKHSAWHDWHNADCWEIHSDSARVFRATRSVAMVHSPEKLNHARKAAFAPPEMPKVPSS